MLRAPWHRAAPHMGPAFTRALVAYAASPGLGNALRLALRSIRGG